MGHLDSRRLTLEELAEIRPIVSKTKQQSCFGCGNGTTADPFTWEEYQTMVSAGTWNGGCYLGEGGETTDEEDDEDDTCSTTDSSPMESNCLAYALAAALGTISWGAIYMKMVEFYSENIFTNPVSNGAPLGYELPFIQNYFSNATYIEKDSIPNGPINDILSIYRPSGQTDYHVVNGLSKSDDLIFVKDPQQNQQYFIPTQDSTLDIRYIKLNK